MKLRHLPPPLSLSLNITPAWMRVLGLVAAWLCVWTVLTLWSQPLRIVEERLGSLGWTLFPDTQTEQQLTLIAIDEQSLAEIGPWPWPRDVFTALSQKLGDAGVALQLYDLVLPEAKPGDAQLSRVLQDNTAVLAQIPLLGDSQPLQQGVMSDAVAHMACQNPIPSTSYFLASDRHFQQVAKGHITPRVDTDGMVRQAPPLICVEGRAYPSLALSGLLQATAGMPGHHQAPALTLSKGQGLWAPDWELNVRGMKAFTLPLNARGDARLSYAQDPAAFRVISAVDVLQGRYDPAWLNNTWALVGATAFGLGDVVPTPFSGMAPGVELQARLISSMLSGQTPIEPRYANVGLWLEALLFAGLLILLASRAGRVSFIGLPIASVVLPLLAWLGHLLGLLLPSQPIWFGWLFPATFGLVGALCLLLLEYGRTRLERRRVFDNLCSYLPSEVATEIAFHQPSGAIHARREDLVIMSADLRNYAAYQEARPPEEAATLLHCFFTEASHLIEAHGGTVHEFKGDALLAVWSLNDHAVNSAVTAARALYARMQQWLPQMPPPGLEPLDVGIGIEAGPALVGSIGPAYRRHHTLLGETVTLALRIQSMTAELAQPILLGGQAAADCSAIELTSQGRYLLEGLKVPRTLYALNDGEHSADILKQMPLTLLKGGRAV